MTTTRVLITGGAGFIGHHLVEHILLERDWEIVLLDRLDTSGNLNRLTDLHCWKREKHRVKFFFHDLKAPISPMLEAQLGKFQYIFHLAASTHVDRSIDEPELFVLDNVLGTTHLLQFARRALRKNSDLSPGKFFYFSTDEVFGPAPEGRLYKEWDRYCSGNPYAASKAGGEEMALAFANTYHLPVIVTHTMNVFGERQHPEKFIPKCIGAILRGDEITIHANKDLTRAGSRYYIHARNVARALLYLELSVAPIVEVYYDKFNIVGEREVDNKELAEKIWKIMDQKGTVQPLRMKLVDFHSSRPGHDLRYALDGKRMRQMNWQPPEDFDQSLEKTVQWYLDHPEWLSA